MTSSEPTSPAHDNLLGEMEDETDRIPLRERYGLILLLILVAYAASGFGDRLWVQVLNALVWGTVLLASLWSPGIPRVVRRVGLLATLIVFLSGVPLGWFPPEWADGVRSLVLAVAQLAALLAILTRILRHDTVSLQTVMGGVAAYALIAFAMGSVYLGLDVLMDDQFLNDVVDGGDYSYFSFVTLTTVGYGDITAASDVAKRLVVIEAFVGQVFIITFVARLVSLWGKPLRPSA
jgi:hypothetical protein